MIAISEAHNTARLAGSRDALFAGAGLPLIHLYADTQPAGGAAPGVAPMATATIASGVIVDGQLLLTPTTVPVIVMSTGTPTWARIVDGDGAWWMDGDASTDPGALVTLVTPGPYYYGGRIVIDSVVIG